jgi:predicted PurR-regulated permease PerM
MSTEIEKVDVTWSAIFKFFFVFVLFYFIFLTREVLIWTLLALVISILFNPLLEILEKKKIPRAFAGFIVYFGFLFIAFLLLYFLIPPIINEVQSFSANIYKYFEALPKILNNFGIDLKNISSFALSIKDELIGVSSGILGFVVSIFGSVFAGITIFALALFLSIEKEDIFKLIKSATPKKWEEDVLAIWERSQEKVSSWFASRVMCSIGISILTFLACVILNIKFAITLALLAGLLNIIPFFGPLIAAILIITVAMFDSVNKALLAAIASIIIQQVEHNIFTPIFTKKMVGIPTFLVLFSILIGGKLMGIVGALLAIPLVGIFYETIRSYFLSKRES